MREQFSHGKNSFIAIDDDFGIRSQLEQPLATGAAGRSAIDTERSIGVEACYSDRTELPRTGRDRRRDRGAFGTEAQPITGIFHVAPCKHALLT